MKNSKTRRTFLHGSGAVLTAALAPTAAAGLAPEDPEAIRQLFGEYAQQTQLRVLQDPARQDRVIFASDGQSACGLFPCLIQTVVPLEGTAPLIEMAKQQGVHGGLHWQTGVQELECVKSSGRWMIQRTTFKYAGELATEPTWTTTG